MKRIIQSKETCLKTHQKHMYAFETPYDLKLLSTGWILKETPEKAYDKHFIVELVKR